jgi:DNA (cytosine-5)-methyltransferase 1
MIDYFLKYGKNIKADLKNFLLELESIIKIEGLNVENSDFDYHSEIKKIMLESDYRRLCDLIKTLEVNANKIEFLKKYLKSNVEIESKRFKFADLFAGCGGLSLGLEKAGFSCTFVNEIDEVFCETHYFNNNIPLSNYYVGDLNELVSNFKRIENGVSDLDLVCGGPPCQGFSMANRQKVIDDPRNILYKAYLKFLQFTQPKFFVMENVKGMTNKIDEIITDFNGYLGNKYDIHYSILNAKDFGAPQNRERFFIIGNRVGVNTKDIFSDIEKEKNVNNFVLEDALENLPRLEPKSIKNSNHIENNETGFYISSQFPKTSRFLNFINDTKTSKYVFNHKNRYNNERDIEIFTKLPPGANSLHESIKDIMPYSSRNHIFKDKYFKLDGKKICKTITSHMKFDCNMYIHPTQSRGLSAREAARIQTFPDDFLIRGSQNKWYAQIGNAVPVKLAEVIGRHIIKHL